VTAQVTDGAARPGRPAAFRLLVLLLTTSLPVLAAASELDTCRSITDDSERLACYDAITDSARARKEPPATISAESLFGRDTAQTSAVLQQQTGISPPETLEAVISSVITPANGKQLIGLQNGQHWQLTDGRPLSLATGDGIRIRKAALGSYLLYKQAGGRSIRVRRVDGT
jgi:hypothetical protein